MTRLRTGRPLWLDRVRSTERPAYPAAPAMLDADVVIVGGGITGASTAWMLAERGVRVVLLESGRIAHGSTAASSALLMQEPDEDLGALRARYGGRAAGRIWRRSRDVTARMITALAGLPIGGELTPCDSVYFTTDDPAPLRREFALRRRNGAHVRWLEATTLAGVVGISARAAIRTSGNAQVDPVGACLGLLRAAERAGAGIFERSAARRIDTTPDGVIVHTPAGRVAAGHVVIATGYATPQFRPLLRRFRMSHTYVAVTPVLAPALRRQLGLSDIMLWDTGRPYYYARWTKDGRLLLGGGDRPTAGASPRAARLKRGADDIRRHYSRLYPRLHSIDFEYVWEGIFASTADGLPFIGLHRRYPRHYFALGYGGNGLTFGFLAAEFFTKRMHGTIDPDEALFSFSRLNGHTRQQ